MVTHLPATALLGLELLYCYRNMEHFNQNWPRSRSSVTFAAGVFFLFVALDVRFWGMLVHIDRQEGGMLFWLLLVVGSAAMFGSTTAWIHPSLVLSADSIGIMFGGMPRLASQKVQVLWDDIRRIEFGTFAFQSSRNRQRRNIVALSIECDPAIDLTGCGDGANFVVGTVEEINDRTNSQRDPRAPIHVDLNQPRNVVLIDSSYFDRSLHSVKEQLDILWKSASATQ